MSYFRNLHSDTVAFQGCKALSVFKLLFYSYGIIFLEVRLTYLLSLDVIIYSVLRDVVCGLSRLELCLIYHFLAYRKN